MQDSSTIWNTIFERYGIMFNGPHDDMPLLADLLSRRDTCRPLDLGCGTGRHMLYFGERGFEVYGIDNAIAGLTSTQHRLEDAGLTAHLVQRDIFDALPFADAFFDAIISIQVIHHARLAQIAALIDEMARILKAGGLLFKSNGFDTLLMSMRGMKFGPPRVGMPPAIPLFLGMERSDQ
jgi:SAM-dependent methyltransferase